MKIEPGTKVRIVGYGHPYWTNKPQWKDLLEAGLVDGDAPKNIIHETDSMWCSDMKPELIGQEGIVEKVIEKFGTDKYSYSLSGVKGKTSWYNLEQLEVI